MRRHRRVLILGILLSGGILAGGGVAALRWLRPSLPAPEVADREQLIEWLVTRDLAEESFQTRQALARRLEEQFRGEVDWEATGRRLSLQQRRQLWENLPDLLEPWLLEKVDGYFGRSERERPAYVDRVIDTINEWRGVNSLRPETAAEDNAGQQPPGLMTMLYQRIDAIERESNPDRRERAGQFLAAVQTRWFYRAFQGVLPKQS